MISILKVKEKGNVKLLLRNWTADCVESLNVYHLTHNYCKAFMWLDIHAD